jgi:hypothetical protein
MPDSDPDIAAELRRSLRHLVWATALLYIGLLVLFGLGWRDSHQRLADIQQNRIESCVHTYAGVREVFLPFFPPPKARSHAQQKTLAKFDATIRRLEAKCPKQTRP